MEPFVSSFLLYKHSKCLNYFSINDHISLGAITTPDRGYIWIRSTAISMGRTGIVSRAILFSVSFFATPSLSHMFLPSSDTLHCIPYLHLNFSLSFWAVDDAGVLLWFKSSLSALAEIMDSQKRNKGVSCQMRGKLLCICSGCRRREDYS